jgi:uncharacterized protein YjeT (DUF2065 family)
MMGDWMIALALVLILEGMLPLAAPAFWRDAFRRAVELSDGQLRLIGALSMAGGLALILLLK